jgi:hypothetical protein
MHLNKVEFDNKCSEIIKDVKEQEVRSSAWGWMAVGALAGLALSCIRFTKDTVKPTLSGFRKEDGINGKFNSKRNSENN